VYENFDGEGESSKLSFQGALIYKVDIDDGFTLVKEMSELSVEKTYEDFVIEISA
jgi:hypothetical protein